MKSSFQARIAALACLGVLVAVSLPSRAAQGTGAAAAPAQPSAAPPPAAPLIDQYCLGCHNDRLRTAGLSLAALDVGHVANDAATWEKVVRKLRTGAMPPVGARRPDRAAALEFVSAITARLDRAAAANPDPGRVTLHRLNRAEYANAVRDLLGVEIDSRALLPQDDSDLGFDNMADILSVSPTLLDRYISAARTVSRMALGLEQKVGLEVFTVPEFKFQDARMSDDLPFGSRGGIAIQHYFPFDGEYVVKIRLARQLYEYIRGLDEPQQIDVGLDGRRVTLFTVGGAAPGRAAPLTYAGELRGDPEWERYLREADDGLEVRLTATRGLHKIGVSFIDRPWEAEGPLQPTDSRRRFSIDQNTSSYSWKPEAAIHSVSIAPADGANRSQASLAVDLSASSSGKLQMCGQLWPSNEEACAKKTVRTLARRAFRRPATEADVVALMTHYAQGRREGDFWTGIGRVIEYILVDPEFLFRIEPDPAVPPGTVYRMGDVPLASRLSFFLWSSIPDNELLGLAERGKLSDPAIMEQQVRRMLRDERAQAFIDNFFGQWLTQRALERVAPVPELFTDFDDNLREAFSQETRLFLESQLREDRKAIELVTADYTYVNERLARHYGIPNVYGSRFRRVTLPEGTRGGVLGQGSILTVSSYAHRTSPVIRGKWLLDNMFGSPPPPPPPNVPALPDATEGGKSLSVRARLEQHRKSPVCAACHARMDPLGFALENFDAIGAWRTLDGGAPIDTSGSLPDGTKIDGFKGLQQLLASRQDDFATTATEKLMTYALGRGLDPSDMPSIRAITRRAARDDYRWSTLILGVVNSMPFQYRRSAS
ncbi:MAG TPA: DUF1592 domain-containing protein [Caulobacterales bacterium]|nr:DUF1592 domain-containing protein [Caulobacterales bacterium]